MSEQDITPPQSPAQSLPASPPRRYPALRIIAIIYRVMAYIVAAVTVIGLLYGLAMSVSGLMPHRGYGGMMPMMGPWLGFGLVSLLYGLVLSVSLYAASELIMLLIDLESNTREGNLLLRNLIEKR